MHDYSEKRRHISHNIQSFFLLPSIRCVPSTQVFEDDNKISKSKNKERAYEGCEM